MKITAIVAALALALALGASAYGQNSKWRTLPEGRQGQCQRKRRDDRSDFIARTPAVIRT